MGKEREKEFAELEKQCPTISQEEFEQQQLDYLKTLPDQMKQSLTDESLRAVGENCQELEKLDMQGCELVTSNFFRAADCQKI